MMAVGNRCATCRTVSRICRPCQQRRHVCECARRAGRCAAELAAKARSSSDGSRRACSSAGCCYCCCCKHLWREDGVVRVVDNGRERACRAGPGCSSATGEQHVRAAVAVCLAAAHRHPARCCTTLPLVLTAGCAAPLQRRRRRCRRCRPLRTIIVQEHGHALAVDALQEGVKVLQDAGVLRLRPVRVVAVRQGQQMHSGLLLGVCRPRATAQPPRTHQPAGVLGIRRLDVRLAGRESVS